MEFGAWGRGAWPRITGQTYITILGNFLFSLVLGGSGGATFSRVGVLYVVPTYR